MVPAAICRRMASSTTDPRIQQDRPDAADPVDVFEAIDIPKSRSLGTRRVDRRHAMATRFGRRLTIVSPRE